MSVQTGVDPGYPKLISNDWPGLTGDIDAAFTWPNNRATYFFKGKRKKDPLQSPNSERDSIMCAMHCTENMIYVFPEMKLHGLVSVSYIHVFVSDFSIPRIDLPNWLQQNRHPGNI
jgi:hypothetical protein